MKKALFLSLQWRLGIWGLLLFGAPWAWTATIEVTEETEAALRAAIATAAPGDTVQIASPNEPTPIFLTQGEIIIDKNLTVIGMPNKTVISGSLECRLFKVLSGNVTLSSFTLMHGNAAAYNPPYGAGIYNAGSLFLTNCALIENGRPDLGTNNHGGAVYNCGNLLVSSNCVFGTNISSSFGGAIFNRGTTIVNGGAFYFNNAQLQGGAIDNQGQLTMNNSLLYLNVAVTNGGGAIYNHTNGVALLNSCVLQTNLADHIGGGGIYNAGMLALTNSALLENMTITYAGTNFHGAGIYNSRTLTVHNCSFSENVCSSFGGAIFNRGTAMVADCQFLKNKAQLQGGAVDNLGTLTLTNCIFLQNEAVTTGGGGVYNHSNNVATLTYCRFTNNVARYYGGGAIMNLGSLYVTNSMMAYNLVDSDSGAPVITGGGALYNHGGLACLDTTMIGPLNTTRRGGGILNLSSVTSAPARLILHRSTIHSNWVTRLGGGLLNLANGGPAMAFLTNSSVIFNCVTNPSFSGGGIDCSANLGASTVTMMSCTVASNMISFAGSPAGAGIFAGSFPTVGAASADIYMRNTIVGGNKSYSGGAPTQGNVYQGTLHSLGYNLCSDIFTPLTPTNNPTDVRAIANLGLFLNSGFVLVPYLLGNSPAIDRGDPDAPRYDQRGFPRPFGRGMDIGAYEQTMRFVTNVVFFGGTNIQLYFTPYVYPTNYVVEWTSDLSNRTWNVLTVTNVTATTFNRVGGIPPRPFSTNVVTVIHGGGAVGPRKFYRVWVP